MKGAFEYACKIWEENINPCLPLKYDFVTLAMRDIARMMGICNFVTAVNNKLLWKKSLPTHFEDKIKGHPWRYTRRIVYDCHTGERGHFT